MSTNSNEKVLTGVRTVNALLSGLHAQEDSDESLREHSYGSDQARFETIRTSYDDTGRIRYTDDLNNARLSNTTTYTYGGSATNIAGLGSSNINLGGTTTSWVIEKIKPIN